MPSCPNCGRKTLRTLDWACQWCGYPLLSKSYKKIDKTYKELQEERNITARPAPPEEPLTEYTPDFETETETAPEPTYQPEISERPVIEPETPSAPEPETEPEPELLAEPEPEPQPEALPAATKKTARKRKTKAAPKAKKKSRKKAETAAEPTPEAEPAPEPMITPPPAAATEPMITPPPAATTEPMITPPPAPEPAAASTPEPAPIAVPKIETLTDGQLLTVDGLDALFRENKIASNTALTDKTMKIQGVIEKIFIRDHIDVRYLVLRGAQKKLLWPVRCTFGKEVVAEMHRLNEGQEVIIQGKYDGYGKNIIFKDCVIVS